MWVELQRSNWEVWVEFGLSTLFHFQVFTIHRKGGMTEKFRDELDR